MRCLLTFNIYAKITRDTEVLLLPPCAVQGGEAKKRGITG